MSRGTNRRGFSLAEVLMFSLVGSVVLYMMYDIFVASNRQGRDLDRKLKAVQGSQLLLERLERDLKHVIYQKGTYELAVDDDGLGVQFFIFDGHGQDMADGVIPIRKRVYRFEPAAFQVMIDGVAYAPAYFRGVEFQLGDAGGGDHPILSVRVGGVAEDMKDLPEEELDLKTRADFVSSVGLPAIAAAARDPFWRSSLQYKVAEGS